MILPLLPLCAPLALAPGIPCEETHVRVFDGMPGPEGGVLVPIGPNAGGPPGGATLGGGGRIAFVAEIQGNARNQGVFVADETRVTPIALGCGGAGGSGQPGTCGDPAPTGGTFAGFFRDAWFAPTVNEAGDVLFLADVAGGSSSRGLFLYRAVTGAIETIAAVGDPSPLGPAITAVGPGSLNNNGDVACLVFLETPPSQDEAAILLHSAGVLTTIAAAGLPGPGGQYQLVGGGLQIMPDNTYVPTGVVPDVDDQGNVAFSAYVSDANGIVLQRPGALPTWVVRIGHPVPGGGVFWSFNAPCLGAGGELAFTGTYLDGPNTWRATFAGSPGAWRRVLGPGDPVGTSTVLSVERSRNPFQPLAPDGSVVLWARVQHADGTTGEMHLRVGASGEQELLARTGESSPLGTIDELFRWPSTDGAGRTTTSALVSGAGVTRGTWIRSPCGVPATYCEPKRPAGSCLPRIGFVGSASLTSMQPFRVTASDVPGQQFGMLFYGFTPAAIPFQGGLRCVAAPVLRTPPQTSTGPAAPCSGSQSFDFGTRIHSGVDPALIVGATVYAQWWTRDPQDPFGFGTGLTDAISFTIAP